MQQPMLGFLNLCESHRVFAAREWPGLKCAQTINHNGQQRLLRYAVDALLCNRTVLKTNSTGQPLRGLDHVFVVCPTSARFIKHSNFEKVIRWIDAMLSNLTHMLSC